MKYRWEEELSEQDRSALEVWRRANDLHGQGYTASVPGLLVRWAVHTVGLIERDLDDRPE